MATKKIYAKVKLGRTIHNIANVPKRISSQLDGIMEDAMDRTERDMKLKVPKDMGQLVNSIQSESSWLQKQIEISAFYAPYVEFGTGIKAAQYASSLPADWAEYAERFRGRSGHGNFDEFLERMKKWVKRKGITGTNGQSNSQIAYAIARSIILQGVTPHPFIYPAVEKNMNMLLKKARKIKYKSRA